MKEKILDTNEKVLSKKGTEEMIQRTIIKERDGGTFKVISEIKKKKIKKEMIPEVINRMKWEKFGIVKGQQRGSLEPGIVVTSNEEIHIIDRKKEIELDIGDKLRESINNRKMIVLQEMKEARERENKEKLAAYGAKNKVQKQQIRRNREGTIKISGFPPTFKAEDLVEVFKKVGEVRRCTMPSKNIAFLEFLQSVHAKDAYDRFNDEPINGCVLSITILENK